MGEIKKSVWRVGFGLSLKLEFHDSRVTSNAGLLAYSGENRQHTLTAWLPQFASSRWAGDEDTNEAKRLCGDSTMRQVFGGREKWDQAASRS